jgi:glycosyl hydrolase family 15
MAPRAAKPDVVRVVEGMVAAPTTSVPERIGGERNWDYRHCWLRDATFTLYALLTGGYVDEARAWRAWLVNAAAGTPSQLQLMYGLAGERRLPEFELDWLPGYEGSRPVRTGNAAARQHQLDVYGEVTDAFDFARRAGLRPAPNAWAVQRALVQYLETDWRSPTRASTSPAPAAPPRPAPLTASSPRSSSPAATTHADTPRSGRPDLRTPAAAVLHASAEPTPAWRDGSL